MGTVLKLTIGDILKRQYFKEARVVAGNNGLNRIIKWVHIMEVTEIGQLLNGNELILSTGVGWKEDQNLSLSFLQQLIENNASGLCIELGKHSNRLSEKMIDYAEQNDFPLIIFNHEVRFIDLTQDLNTLIIDNQYKIMTDLEAFSSKLNHLLLSTDGFSGILRLLHTYLNVQVAFVPVEGDVQFFPTVGSITKKEKILSDIQSLSLKEMKQNTECRQSGSSAYQAIYAIGHKFADLIIFSDTGEWTGFEFLILDRAAIALAQDLLKELYTEEKRKRTENQWLQKWLEGGHRKEEIAQHLSLTEPSLKANGCVVCLCQLAIPERKSDLTYYSIVLRSIFEQHGYYLFASFEKSQMIFVLINKKGQEDWKIRLDHAIQQLKGTTLLKEQLKGKPIFAVGKMFDELNQVDESYQMASEALSIGKRLGKSELTFYEDLYVQRLISLLNKQGHLEDFIDDYIGSVLEFDVKHKSEMLTTLRVFLEVNGSKKEAANRLFIVRQTLYHRIEKLNDLLGDDFMQSEKRLAIEFAVHAHKFVAS